ncbi:MAG: response regulator transcription factor [Desulforhabdus sp.]|jgi:DNA-binding NarL/FixJ family response regulator|nr:response regulator transcription factor [Desulforhabdus sp.]
MKIRILIADDHKIVRDGLRALLEQQADMEVIAEAENGRKAVRLARELNPDIVIIDIGMPDLNGIDAARQIIAEVDRVRVIALSMHSDKRFVAQMFKAGASAYLLKDCAFEELAQAVNIVMSGQTYLSPEIAGSVIEDYVQYLSTMDSSGFSILTVREREVLQLLAEGKPTKEIATRLHVSIKTIETHRQQIMHKLKVRSLADLTKYAIREGLTSLEP